MHYIFWILLILIVFFVLLRYKIIRFNTDIYKVTAQQKDPEKIEMINEVEEIGTATDPTDGKKYRSKGEEICCKTMKEIYGLEFSSFRPDFLKNPETGRNLEIDCYNPHVKIGVEYNGVQHYKWPNFTKQTQAEFINQLRRDQYKVKKCDENGYYLIRVPYTVKHKDIPKYIMDRIPMDSITYYTSEF